MPLMDLDKRMKLYELPRKLPINMPVILRLDGRAFHTFTRKFKKPFDDNFMDMMNQVGLAICDDVQNARLAYLQSDEISVLILNRLESSCWFDNDVQKICSISASLASSVATSFAREIGIGSNICFDARANVYPLNDVVNYMVYRQRDWERNSLQMLARSFYSQKALQNKGNEQMHDLIHAKGENWNDLPTRWKRGRCIVKVKYDAHVKNEHFEGDVERSKWVVDNEIPIFTKDRRYIERRLEDDYLVSGTEDGLLTKEKLENMIRGLPPLGLEAEEEDKCPKCNGCGRIPLPDAATNKMRSHENCPDCKGTGMR